MALTCWEPRPFSHHRRLLFWIFILRRLLPSLPVSLAPQAQWHYIQDVATELGLRIGSPSAAYCGAACTGGYNSAIAWFDAFFAACRAVAGGCRVDFMATHWYSCKLEGLKQYLLDLHDR